MTKAIIVLVGISLLTRHIEKIITDEDTFNHFAEKFLDGFNIYQHKKVEQIVKIINPDKKSEIIKYFSNIVGSGNTVSAELNSLSQLFLQKQDILYFLYSNTLSGEICSNVFYEHFRNICNATKPITIQNLSDDFTSFNNGLRELTDKVIEIIDWEKSRGNEVIINATGGFKPEGIYAALSGMLNDVKSVYIHESFNRIIELPSIPINFDLLLFHKNAIWIRQALKGNKEAYNKLPEKLKNFIDFNPQNNSPFKPLGNILWNSYCSSISCKGRVFPKIGLIDTLNTKHQKKVLGFLEKWDSLWLGDQIYQMIDHEQSHCQDLLNFAEEVLIPILEDNSNFLDEKEIYYLLASIFLHDIGISETVDENNNFLNPEQIRKKHGELTYQMIKNNPSDFGFDTFDEDAKSIANICKYHQRRWDLSDLPEKDKDGIRIRFVTVLLRIFDACDIQRSRAGEEEFCKLKMNANLREIRFYKKILEEDNLPSSIRELIDSKIRFIEKQEQHFKLHSEIALIHMEPKKANKGWICKIICHPIRKDENIYQSFKTYIEGEFNASCVKETLNNNLINFLIEKGHPYPEI